MMKYASFLIAILMTCLSLYAQEPNTIKGTVIDFLSSKPIANANVSVKGVEGESTESSDIGEFEIKTQSLYAVLVVSTPGYQTKEFSLLGSSKVTIELIPEGLSLGESTVKLPYGDLSEKDKNGAYTILSKPYDKTIEYRDIYQMLEGAVPGLEVSACSGIPGDGSKLNLRGTRSLYAGNDPLIVVDGVQVVNQFFTNSVVRGNIYDYLTDINVKDIESITVLRDASAVGIYGSRAANGAIVITTKQGTDGKTFLDVSVQQGISSRYEEMPVMNATEYLSFLSDKLFKQGFDQQTIAAQFPFFTNTNTNTAEYWMYANNTNWQKEVTRDAFSQDYYLNLRGGDVTSKYSLNVGYNDLDGVVRGVSNNRLTSRFNLDFRISPKLSAGLRVGFSRTTKKLMDQGFDERTNPLYLGLVKPPIFAPYQKSNQGVDGPFLSQPGFDLLSNPIAVVKGVKNDVLNTWILGSVFAQYEFNRSLQTKVALSIDRKGLEEDRFTPANGLVPVNNDIRFDRTSEEQLVTDQYLRIEHTLNYNKTFNQENRLDAVLGYNVEISDFESVYGYTIHSASDDFQGLGDGMKLDMSGVKETTHGIGVFANVDYIFREKLFFKAGIRVDGSSKFGDQVDGAMTVGSVPYVALPFTGITWKVKAEPWMSSLSFVNELKCTCIMGNYSQPEYPGKRPLFLV
ncbi:MAG: TonB-dependent receptor plug domain-containing protein [Mangrovibacterium sp.]